MDKFILYKENINVSENIINSIGSSLLNVILAGAVVYCLYDIVALFFSPPINNNLLHIFIPKQKNNNKNINQKQFQF